MTVRLEVHRYCLAKEFWCEITGDKERVNSVIGGSPSRMWSNDSRISISLCMPFVPKGEQGQSGCSTAI